MSRHLLLAAAVLTITTACTTTAPPPSTARTATPADSPASTTQPQPTGITSRDAARIGPLGPAQLTAIAENGTVRLTWPATGEDVSYYQCLRRIPPGIEWEPAGRTSSAVLTCTDHPPHRSTYIYGVQAISPAGRASPITESSPITAG